MGHNSLTVWWHVCLIDTNSLLNSIGCGLGDGVIQSILTWRGGQL